MILGDLFRLQKVFYKPIFIGQDPLIMNMSYDAPQHKEEYIQTQQECTNGNRRCTNNVHYALGVNLLLYFESICETKERRKAAKCHPDPALR